MWKPGAGKPPTPNKSGGRKPKQSPRSLATSMSLQDDDYNEKAVAASTKSPIVKKLSSGTMNMRFMQRRTAVSPKQAVAEQQTQVASTTSIAATPPMTTTTSTPRRHHSDMKKNYSNNATSPMEDVEYDTGNQRIHQQQQIYENADSVDEQHEPTIARGGRFIVASAQDMYGPTLMGRRSFGGFHPIVEQMHQQQVAAVEKSSGGGEDSKRKRKRNKK